MTIKPITHTSNVLECSSFRVYYFLHRGRPVIVILQAGLDSGCHILNTSHVTAVETRHPSGARVVSPHPSPAPWDTRLCALLLWSGRHRLEAAGDLYPSVSLCRGDAGCPGRGPPGGRCLLLTHPGCPGPARISL